MLAATGLLVRQPCSLYSCHLAGLSLKEYLIHLPVLLLGLHNSFHCKPLFSQTFLGSSSYVWFIHVTWVSFSCLLENLDKRDDWQPPRVQHSWGESYAFCLLCAIFNENPDWNLTWYRLFRIMWFCLVYERLLFFFFLKTTKSKKKVTTRENLSITQMLSEGRFGCGLLLQSHVIYWGNIPPVSVKEQQPPLTDFVVTHFR